MILLLIKKQNREMKDTNILTVIKVLKVLIKVSPSPVGSNLIGYIFKRHKQNPTYKLV